MQCVCTHLKIYIRNFLEVKDCAVFSDMKYEYELASTSRGAELVNDIAIRM